MLAVLARKPRSDDLSTPKKFVGLRLILFFGEVRCPDALKKILWSSRPVYEEGQVGPEFGFNATISTLRILSALAGRRPKRARAIAGSGATSAAAISLYSPVTAERSPHRSENFGPRKQENFITVREDAR